MFPPKKPKKSLLVSLILPAIGFGVSLLLAGCERKTKTDKAKEEVEEAVRAVGEAVEEAVGK